MISRANSHPFYPTDFKENSNTKEQEEFSDPVLPSQEHLNSPLKQYHPKTPESNYPHPTLRDLITSHMTYSLMKQSNNNNVKKKVVFEVNKEKDRGRDQMNGKRNSPQSASLNKRKTNHVDWGNWFLDKVQKSQENNNPRSIIMKEFLKFRNGKENISKSPLKYEE